MRTLNVVKTTIRTVCQKWNITLTARLLITYNVCYIRCDKTGNVNWDKAPIYSEKELIDRKICIRNLKNP